MTDKTDFSMLYHELGIEPDAGVEALQHAYRRCLRRLHPDTGDGNGAGETVDLSWLVRDYRRALAFHHAHGRLPGTPDREHSPGTAAPASASPASLPVMQQAQVDLSGIGPFSRWLQVLVIVIMVMIGIGLLLP